MSELLPEPDTPVTQVNTLSGILTSMPRRLFIRAPLISIYWFQARWLVGAFISSLWVRYLMV
ncbi:Uncharacterised protein [Segatella copri]|nr:Uncharacterised protein [Segatella copri]